jgi:nucleolar protein TMA23
MNAEAYLLRYGWSGPGNPLNPDRARAKKVGGPRGGLGLTRPILISRKVNFHGVGKKKMDDPSEPWWLQKLEDALRRIKPGAKKDDNPNDQKDGSSRAESEGNSLPNGRGELYKCFVRGKGLRGTIDGDNDLTTMESMSESEASTSPDTNSRGVLSTDEESGGEHLDKGQKKERSKSRKRKHDESVEGCGSEEEAASLRGNQNSKKGKSKGKSAAKESGKTTASKNTKSESKNPGEQKAKRGRKPKPKNIAGEDEANPENRSKGKEKVLSNRPYSIITWSAN